MARLDPKNLNPRSCYICNDTASIVYGRKKKGIPFCFNCLPDEGKRAMAAETKAHNEERAAGEVERVIPPESKKEPVGVRISKESAEAINKVIKNAMNKNLAPGG